MSSEIDILSLQVVGIFSSPAMGAPMVEHESIQAIAGLGLVSHSHPDRYAARMGAYSERRTGKPGRISDSDRQVALIATGGIDEANAILAKQGIPPFTYSETRRGLVVLMSAEELRGLVGKKFRVCGVVMKGVEDCTPCKRPAMLANRKGDAAMFEAAFEGRGGLRARILTDGTISSLSISES